MTGTIAVGNKYVTRLSSSLERRTCLRNNILSYGPGIVWGMCRLASPMELGLGDHYHAVQRVLEARVTCYLPREGLDSLEDLPKRMEEWFSRYLFG